MEVNTYTGFWSLKMKCKYGSYGQATFKNARTKLFFEVGRSEQGAWASSGNEGGMPGAGPTLSRGNLAQGTLIIPISVCY